MLREGSAGVISGAGDVFAMKMHNDEIGDYEMSNHVVEYELNCRIGWEPVLRDASRPEDQPGIGDRSEHRWSFELTPLGSGSTLVTETYACSRARMAAQRRQGRHPLDRQHDEDAGKLDALSRG